MYKLYEYYFFLFKHFYFIFQKIYNENLIENVVLIMLQYYDYY